MLQESNLKPFFIITVGATGSGKTGLINKTMEYLGIQTQEYVKILVDDLVENDPKYKASIMQIIDKVINNCKQENICNKRCYEYYTKDQTKYEECIESEVKICEQQKYNNPSDTLFKEFADAYYFSRQKSGCLGNSENLNCNDLNDKILIESIRQNKHIILESNGTYIPKWVLSSEWIPNNYTVIFAYSLVTLNNLIERNKSRAYKSIQEFRLNSTNPAPRLPNVSKEIFGKKVKDIYDVLIELFDKCFINKNADICGTKQIDRLLLFDNNGDSLINIYDSTTDNNKNIEEFKDKINCSFGLIINNSYEKKYKKYKSKYLKLKK
jgi:hypothetical protein